MVEPRVATDRSIVPRGRGAGTCAVAHSWPPPLGSGPRTGEYEDCVAFCRQIRCYGPIMVRALTRVTGTGGLPRKARLAQLRALIAIAVLGLFGPAASAVANVGVTDASAAGESALVALAKARYGTDAALRVSAWEALIEDQSARSEAERVRAVNAFVNDHLGYGSDDAVWNKPDHWASPLEALGVGAGDCEDYSITKYVTLLRAGVAPGRLRITYVRAQVTGSGVLPHMVLAYYARPNAEPLILDNLVPAVQRASARADLRPVFGFNSEGFWVNGVQSRTDPSVRLSRWRDLLARMAEEGVL